MASVPLLEEEYAPDQYKVLVTCIFLNRTPALRARPFLSAFLRRFPTPQSLEGASPHEIKNTYFLTLGLHRRAWYLVRLAKQFLNDPPRPNVLRRKEHGNAGYESEVAHLAGIGDYGSDAWRLFCKVDFYDQHNITIQEEWASVNPNDKDLRRYVQRRRRDYIQQNIDEEMGGVVAQFGDLQVSRAERRLGAGVLVGRGNDAMFIPWRILDNAESFQPV